VACTRAYTVVMFRAGVARCSQNSCNDSKDIKFEARAPRYRKGVALLESSQALCTCPFDGISINKVSWNNSGIVLGGENKSTGRETF
jgi:hypothetical protein